MKNCKCGSSDIVGTSGSDGNVYIYCYDCQRQVKGSTVEEAEENWERDIPEFRKKVGVRPKYKNGLVNG